MLVYHCSDTSANRSCLSSGHIVALFEYFVNILLRLVQILSKVSRGEHTVLEQAREVIQREMEEETYERLRKIKKSVMEQMPGSFSSCGSLDLRKKYMSMPAAEVTLEVFSNAEGMFTSKIAKVGSNTDRCLLLMIRYIKKTCSEAVWEFCVPFVWSKMIMTPSP